MCSRGCCFRQFLHTLKIDQNIAGTLVKGLTYIFLRFKSEVKQGGKSPPPPLLFKPISPSSLKFNFFFSLLPTFSPYFSILPTLFGPFLPPPYSVPPPSFKSFSSLNYLLIFQGDPQMYVYQKTNTRLVARLRK